MRLHVGLISSSQTDRKFFCILNTSNSMYQLDQNILLHSRHLHFFVFYLTKYSFAFLTHPFLCIFSTLNILLHQHHLNFFVSNRPEYSSLSSTHPFLRIYSTKIFCRILNTSLSLYLLDQIFFCILDTLILRIYSTIIFFHILNTSNSLYQLDLSNSVL